MGLSLDTGLLSLSMTECLLASLEDFQRDYEAAEEGEPVPLKLRISGPCRFLSPSILQSDTNDQDTTLHVQFPVPNLEERSPIGSLRQEPLPDRPYLGRTIFTNGIGHRQ